VGPIVPGSGHHFITITYPSFPLDNRYFPRDRALQGAVRQGIAGSRENGDREEDGWRRRCREQGD
jgi:hypothetical protein